MVDDERLESLRSFKSKHLSYINHISENTYEPRLYLWENYKYKEVKEFIKKLHSCDEDFMRPKELIAYGPLVQEAMGELCKIVTSIWWEPTDIK